MLAVLDNTACKQDGSCCTLRSVRHRSFPFCWPRWVWIKGCDDLVGAAREGWGGSAAWRLSTGVRSKR